MSPTGSELPGELDRGCRSEANPSASMANASEECLSHDVGSSQVGSTTSRFPGTGNRSDAPSFLG
jgi:hypothetical protein